MTTAVDDPLVADYLHRLRLAARSLPRPQRRELLADIAAHIDAALADVANAAGAAGEADVRNVLDDLGPPDVIVGAAVGAGPDAAGAHVRGLRDISTIVLLLVGGVVLPIIGWLIGVVLLWTSTSWTTARKLVATLVWPGGLGLGLVVFGLAAVLTSSESGSSTYCTSGDVAARSSGNGLPPVTHPTAPHCVTTSTSSSAIPEVLIIILFVLLVVAPIVVAVGLYRSAGRGAAPAATRTGPLAAADA